MPNAHSHDKFSLTFPDNGLVFICNTQGFHQHNSRYCMQTPILRLKKPQTGGKLVYSPTYWFSQNGLALLLGYKALMGL